MPHLRKAIRSLAGLVFVAAGIAATSYRVEAAGSHNAAELLAPAIGVELRAAPAAPWVAATAGAPIAPGTAIRTSSSAARIRLPDGTVVGLAPSTTLRVQVPTEISMDPGSNVRVSHCDLTAGELSMAIPPRAKPVLVMGGTDLFAAFRPGKARAIRNSQGLVAIVDQGSARVASSGRWFSLASGQYQVLPERGPVGTAQAIGPVPAFSSKRCEAVGGRACAVAVVVGDGTARLGASWEPSAPNHKYLVKLARDPALQDVVEQQERPGSATAFTSGELPPGQYWFEVRSVTPDGIPSDAAVKPMRVIRVVPDPGVIHVPSEGVFVLPAGRGVALPDRAGVVVSMGGGHATAAPGRLSLIGTQTRRVVRLAVQGTPNDVAPLTLEARALEADVEFSPRNASWPRDRVEATIRLVDPNHRISPAVVRPKASALVGNKRYHLPLTKQGDRWVTVLPQGDGPGPWIVQVQVTDEDGAMMGKAVLEVVHDDSTAAVR
jgi:hypothetical protein